MEYNGGLDKYGIKAVNAPGLGEAVADLFGLSGAVVVPPNTPTVRTSGTTGLNDDLQLPASATEQVLRAFHNVEATLVAAGVADGWRAVFDMTTYHTGALDDPEVGAALATAFAQYLQGNRPAWAAVQVANLYKGARIEIRVTAAQTRG